MGMNHAQSNGIGLWRPTNALDWALNLKDIHGHAAPARSTTPLNWSLRPHRLEGTSNSESTHTKSSGSLSNVLDPGLDSVLTPPPPPLASRRLVSEERPQGPNSEEIDLVVIPVFIQYRLLYVSYQSTVGPARRDILCKCLQSRFKS